MTASIPRSRICGDRHHLLCPACVIGYYAERGLDCPVCDHVRVVLSESPVCVSCVYFASGMWRAGNALRGVCGSGGAFDLSSAYYIVQFIGTTSERGGCPVCVAVRCFVSVVGTFGRAGLGGWVGLLWFVYIAASFVGLFLLSSKNY
jgi:hypothetical protein